MGAVPGAFRTGPDVLRSGHPHSPFAAWGKRARRRERRTMNSPSR
ncbi:AAC(3) family N-acetyltransferase [Deinococcus hopiensis]